MLVAVAWCEVHQGKGGGDMKRNKSILVRLTEQEQSELIQAVEDWNQSRESWRWVLACWRGTGLLALTRHTVT